MRVSWMGFVALLACGGSHPFEPADAGDGGTQGTDAPSFDDVHTGPACAQWTLQSFEPGPDGVLGTADDVLSTKREVQSAGVEQDGVAARVTTYDGATIIQDSRVVPRSANDYDYLTYDGPGPDAVWDTPDDHPSARMWGQGPVGKPSSVESFSSAGPDAKWGTSDDVISLVTKYDYGDGTSKPYLREWQYSSPGNDGVWQTSDDLVGVLTNRYTGYGNFVDAPGADATWGTPDDVISSHYTDERNVNGRFQVLALFSGTSNIQTSLAVTTCEKGVFDARIFSSAGADGVWDTSDDVVQARLRVTGCTCDAMPGSPVAPN